MIARSVPVNCGRTELGTKSTTCTICHKPIFRRPATHLESIILTREREVVTNGEYQMDEKNGEERDRDAKNRQLDRQRKGECGKDLCMGRLAGIQVRWAQETHRGKDLRRSHRSQSPSSPYSNRFQKKSRSWPKKR